MNHFVLSAALSSLFAFTAAVFTWLKNPSRRLNQISGLYWFSMAFWAFFVGTQPYIIELFSAFWWGFFLLLGCTFIPVLLFHFVISWTRQNTPVLRKTLAISYGMTVLFNLLNLWTTSFTNGTSYRDVYAYPTPAALFSLYFVLFVVLVVWSTLLLIQHLPKLPLKKQQVLKVWIATHTLAYLGGMDNFLIMIDVRISPLYPFGIYFIPLYASMAIYAAWRYHLPDSA